MRQSTFGIISFIIALIAGALIVAVLGSVTYFSFDSEIPDGSTLDITLATIFFASLALNVFGAILGGIGLFEKEKVKFFAGVGIFINLAIILSVISLALIGVYFELN